MNIDHIISSSRASLNISKMPLSTPLRNSMKNIKIPSPKKKLNDDLTSVTRKKKVVAILTTPSVVAEKLELKSNKEPSTKKLIKNNEQMMRNVNLKTMNIGYNTLNNFGSEI